MTEGESESGGVPLEKWIVMPPNDYDFLDRPMPTYDTSLREPHADDKAKERVEGSDEDQADTGQEDGQGDS